MGGEIDRILINITKKEKDAWKRYALEENITLTQLIISSVRAHLRKIIPEDNSEKLKIQLEECETEILRLKELLLRNQKYALDETIINNLEDFAISKGWDALNHFQRALARALLEIDVKLEDCIFIVNYFWDMDKNHESFVLQKYSQYRDNEFQIIAHEIWEEWQISEGECNRTIHDIIKDLEGRELLF